MKQMVLLASVLMLLVCSGCGDSPDKVAEDGISVMDEMATVMESVKDEASAKKANAKLRALTDKMKDIKARQEKLSITTEQKIELQKKHEEKMGAVVERLMREGMRISVDPKLKSALDGLDPSGPGF